MENEANEQLANQFQVLRIGHQTVKELQGDLLRLRLFIKQMYRAYSKAYHPDTKYPSEQPFKRISEAESMLGNADDSQLQKAIELFLNQEEFELNAIRMELQTLQRRVERNDEYSRETSQKTSEERASLIKNNQLERVIWAKGTQVLLSSLGTDTVFNKSVFPRQIRDYLFGGDITSKGENIEVVSLPKTKFFPALAIEQTSKSVRWVGELTATIYYVNSEGRVFVRKHRRIFNPRQKILAARADMSSKLLAGYKGKFHKLGTLPTSRIWRTCGILIGSMTSENMWQLQKMEYYQRLLEKPISTKEAISLISTFVDAPVLWSRESFHLVTLEVEEVDGIPFFTFKTLHVTSAFFPPVNLPSYVLTYGA